MEDSSKNEDSQQQQQQQQIQKEEEEEQELTDHDDDDDEDEDKAKEVGETVKIDEKNADDGTSGAVKSDDVAVNKDDQVPEEVDDLEDEEEDEVRTEKAKSSHVNRPDEDEITKIRALLTRLQKQVVENENHVVSLEENEVELLAHLFGRGLLRAPSRMSTRGLSAVGDAGTKTEYAREMSATAFASTVQDIRGNYFWEVDVGFKDLSYTVTVPKGTLGQIKTVGNQFVELFRPCIRLCQGLTSSTQEVKVLNNISGAFRAGTSTLVLGPPGCGVTTLFKSLSGRVTESGKRKLTGDRFYSGYTEKEIAIRKACNYIDQVDNHLPVLSVRETLDFAFKCFGGPRTEEIMEHTEGTDEEKQRFAKLMEEFVEMVIYNFGLVNCADTYVGNDLLRGVSGGERKRVTSTEMLMGRKPVVFADQISTGLDSAATFDISRRLCNVSHLLRTTVVVALLQPPPEVYDLYDEILILSKGQVIYHGERENVLPYFSSIGFECPKNKDIADFIQEVTTDIRGKYAIEGREHPNSTPAMAAAWLESPFSEKKREQIAKCTTGDVEKKPNPVRDIHFDAKAPKFSLSFMDDIRLVINRKFKLTIRDKQFIGARIGQAFVMGIVVGTVFYQLEDDLPPATPNTGLVTQRYGLVFMVLLQSMLGNMAQMPIVIEERKVFYKQSTSYFHRTFSYVLAELVTVLPIVLVETFIFGTLIFWLTNLVPNTSSDVASQYFQFMLFMGTTNIAFGALIRLLATLSPGPEVAQVFAAVFISFCVLFSGFIATPNNIPPWFIWIYWLSPLAWGLRSIIIGIFNASSYSEAQTDFALNLFQFESDFFWIWTGFGVLCGYLILFSMCSCAGYDLIRFDSSGSAGGSSDEDDVDSDIAHRAEEAEKKQRAAESQDVEVEIDRQQTLDQGAGNFKKVDLVFKNLSYTVPSPVEKGQTLDLLHSITGYAQAGTMTALMGSSGAGKTTLMDSIAGRKTGGELNGEIFVNGRPKESVSFARIMGYVEQQDIHSPHATVFEALLFSAHLRQGDEISTTEKENFVKSVISTLELEKIQDFEIGTKSSGGLSVEQAKRVTIGVELAANPSIIFADEPTSGLDAKSAITVMRGISRIAKSGRTVVCTIHQPSKDIFEYFDRLLLLKRGGYTVYFGELGDQSKCLIDYLLSIPGTKPFPNPRYNPATYMLEVIGAGVGGSQLVDYAYEYNESDLKIQEEEKADRIIQENLSDREEVTFEHKYAASFLSQQGALLNKFRRTYWRSPSYNLIRFLVYIFMALLFGLTFVENRGDLSSPSLVQSFLGILFLSTVFIGVINSNIVVAVIIGERAPFYRERSANMYSVLPYAITGTLMEFPYIILSSLVYMPIFYFLIGLWEDARAFFLFWFIFFLYITLATFMGQMFASLASSDQVATIFIGLCTTMFSLFAGFLIAVDDIPTFWIWMAYINPFRYAFNSLASVQLECDCTISPPIQNGPIADLLCQNDDGASGLCSSVCDQKAPGCQIISLSQNGQTLFVTVWSYVVENFGFDSSKLGRDIGVLCAFVVGFRLITAYAFAYVNHLKR